MKGMYTMILRMHINKIDKNLAKAAHWPHLPYRKKIFIRIKFRYFANGNFATGKFASGKFASGKFAKLNLLMMSYITKIQKSRFANI